MFRSWVISLGGKFLTAIHQFLNLLNHDPTTVQILKGHVKHVARSFPSLENNETHLAKIKLQYFKDNLHDYLNT